MGSCNIWVNWLGYSEAEDSSVNAKDISAPDKIAEYHQRHPMAIRVARVVPVDYMSHHSTSPDSSEEEPRYEPPEDYQLFYPSDGGSPPSNLFVEYLRRRNSFEWRQTRRAAATIQAQPVHAESSSQPTPSAVDTLVGRLQTLSMQSLHPSLSADRVSPVPRSQSPPPTIHLSPRRSHPSESEGGEPETYQLPPPPGVEEEELNSS